MPWPDQGGDAGGAVFGGASEARLAASRLHRAAGHLKYTRPELSAGWPVWRWQIWFCCLVLSLTIAGTILVPDLMGFAVLAALSLSFLSLALLRVFALWHGWLVKTCRAAKAHAVEPAVPMEPVVPPQLAPDALPPYSVLVPLFGEAAIAPDLVEALTALNYPQCKLQILLILEQADLATQAALAKTQMPANFEVIIVPSGEPQTKPRALNYALHQVNGVFVTVYDAEDVPEPDQLLKVIAAFQSGPSNLACVQAKLNIYNAQDSWLTRQFTIEYTVLFDWLLPALQVLGLPVPLGGTSNHFRFSDLIAAGAWDPFNVTEDADLGIRLARQGFGVQVLCSTTWEEAPQRPLAWRRQRTRWLKGWLQTYLVHTRQPLALWRDLGAWRFCGLHMLMGGLIVSALVHPWFYVLAAISAWQGTLLQAPTGFDEQLLWGLGLFNLITGYSTGVGLGAVAVERRAWPQLKLQALLMPVYWLMISFAAYWALFQLMSAPYYWEKTEHTARSVARRPAALARDKSTD